MKILFLNYNIQNNLTILINRKVKSEKEQARDLGDIRK